MRRILVFYSHFLPAFKAGGPIQSIANMVELIKERFSIDVVCSAFDLGEQDTLRSIEPDSWNCVDENIRVLYIKTGGIKKIISAVSRGRPDIIYVNGIFLPLYSMLPLFLGKLRRCSVVASPRGMLQKGAMDSGTLKKRLFLYAMKAAGLHRRVRWIASDEQEASDIRLYFGKHAVVEVVGNVPRPPLGHPAAPLKKPGQLRLVYLSLISSKKNLDLVLTILKGIATPIVFDIYGPVKDDEYWQSCQSLISGQVHSIRYCGVVNPTDVSSTLRKYHAFILLTKGENFGHAIYEALSSGTPAIISQHTPWKMLQDHEAGFTVDIQNTEECRRCLERLIGMSQVELAALCDGSARLASKYYEGGDFKAKYESLFQIA